MSRDIDPEIEDVTAPEQAQARRATRRRPASSTDASSTSTRRKQRKAKEQRYTFLDFLKDSRTHFGVGFILCAVAITIVVFCVSFIFSHSEDQAVTHARTIEQIVQSGLEVENVGNAVGAKLSEWLLVDGFGIGSFIWALWLFVVGVACMGYRKWLSWSFTFKCFFSSAAISIVVGLLTLKVDSYYNLGGKHGEFINNILITYSGWMGTVMVSVVLVALLCILYYKPITALVKFLLRLIPKRIESEDETEIEQLPTDESDISVFDNGDSVEDNPEEESGTDHSRYMPSEEPEDEIFGFEDDAETEDEISLSDDGPEVIVTNESDEIGAEGSSVDNSDESNLGKIDTPYDPRASHPRYKFPTTELLEVRDKTVVINAEEQNTNKELIINALRSYGVEIRRIKITVGPTVTLYEIVPAEGVKIAKIRSLEDDLAMSLSALGIRIIAPIPGKGTIGLEVPNSQPQIVGMRSVLESAAFERAKEKMNLPMALGATITNEIFVADLTKMPHLLVAGATGQGKSVGLNCIITSLLYSKHPDELKFVLIDPKMVEFSLYRDITKAYLAKIPDEDNAIITDPQKVIATLNSLCIEMDQRYELLSNAGVRSLEEYNNRIIQRRLNPNEGHRFLPYIVMIVDEFADLIQTAGKEISAPIARIAQKARAVGMHMIIATQRPSVDVITGMIKANFPARIAFRVLSAMDSKTILDRPGAQRLIGRGDMLMFSNGAVERVQCAFIDTEEIERLTEHISSQPGFVECYELPLPQVDGEGGFDGNCGGGDEFSQCAIFVSSLTTASASMLQRKFQIGFNKAARYIDQMEEMGIVSGQDGSKPRQVLMSTDQVRALLAER